MFGISCESAQLDRGFEWEAVHVRLGGICRSDTMALQMVRIHNTNSSKENRRALLSLSLSLRDVRCYDYKLTQRNAHALMHSGNLNYNN